MFSVKIIPDGMMENIQIQMDIFMLKPPPTILTKMSEDISGYIGR